MATVYIKKLQNKLAGALGADVSDSTDAITARADAAETVEALSEIYVTAEFTATTTLAERNTNPIPVPFNCKVQSVQVAFGDGAHGTAAGLTDYVAYRLVKWDASGLNTTTVAEWAPTAYTSAVKLAKQATITATANRLVQNGTFQLEVRKVGAGVSSGVTTMTALLRREDD